MVKETGKVTIFLPTHLTLKLSNSTLFDPIFCLFDADFQAALYIFQHDFDVASLSL